MSEGLCAVFAPIDPKPCLIKTLTESLKIFSRNKLTFSLIYALIALPLSLLHFSLSISSFPIKSQILHLEFLATRSPTRFEARQVWKESRELAISLLHFKLLYFIPIYSLSFIAAITTVTAAESAYNKKPTTVKTALVAFKSTWTRPLVTSICIYAVLLLYASVPHTLGSIIGGSRLKFLIWVIGLGVEIYVVAVCGLGLVDSIVERRSGWGAIRVAWQLMEGRRICGWVLSGLMAVVTGGIGWRMEGLMAAAEEGKWRVAEGWERAGLGGLYGMIVIWGSVLNAVFYCECKKRQVVRGEEEEVELETVGS